MVDSDEECNKKKKADSGTNIRMLQKTNLGILSAFNNLYRLTGAPEFYTILNAENEGHILRIQENIPACCKITVKDKASPCTIRFQYPDKIDTDFTLPDLKVFVS